MWAVYQIILQLGVLVSQKIIEQPFALFYTKDWKNSARRSVLFGEIVQKVASARIVYRSIKDVEIFKKQGFALQTHFVEHK